MSRAFLAFWLAVTIPMALFIAYMFWRVVILGDHSNILPL